MQKFMNPRGICHRFRRGAAILFAMSVCGVTHAYTTYRFIPTNYSGDIANPANWNTVVDGSGTQLPAFTTDAYLLATGLADGRGQDHAHSFTLSQNISINGFSFRVGDYSVANLGGHTITCSGADFRHSWSPNSQTRPVVVSNGVITAVTYYAEGAVRFSGPQTRVNVTPSDDSGFTPQSTSNRGLLSVTDGAQLTCTRRAWLPQNGSNMKIEVVGAGSRIDLTRCDTRQPSMTLTAKDGGVFSGDFILMNATATNERFTADKGTLDFGTFQIFDDVKSPTTFDVIGDGLIKVRGSFVNKNFGSTFNVAVPNGGFTAGAAVILNATNGDGHEDVSDDRHQRDGGRQHGL